MLELHGWFISKVLRKLHVELVGSVLLEPANEKLYLSVSGLLSNS